MGRSTAIRVNNKRFSIGEIHVPHPSISVSPRSKLIDYIMNEIARSIGSK